MGSERTDRSWTSAAGSVQPRIWRKWLRQLREFGDGIVKYMLLIYGAESCWTEQERDQCMIESMAICEELDQQGKWIASSPLHSVTTATSVRVREGHCQITDGPFAETTEQLGGYYVIDVSDLDEAIAIAKRLPPAKKGTVEIRPLFPLPEQSDQGRAEGKS